MCGNCWRKEQKVKGSVFLTNHIFLFCLFKFNIILLFYLHAYLLNWIKKIKKNWQKNKRLFNYGIISTA